MEALDRTELLKLYEVTLKEEQFHLEAHQKRVNFFTGFISTLIGISIYGLILLTNDTLSNWFRFIILLFVPLLIAIISSIAKKGTFRFYRRFIETITVRAKIEQDLGFTKKRSDYLIPWWKTEMIVPPRYIKNRNKCKSSEEFIKTYEHLGYQAKVESLFNVFIWLSYILVSISISMSIFYLCTNIEVNPWIWTIESFLVMIALGIWIFCIHIPKFFRANA